jgi:hypothetical protein
LKGCPKNWIKMAETGYEGIITWKLEEADRTPSKHYSEEN